MISVGRAIISHQGAGNGLPRYIYRGEKYVLLTMILEGR